MKDLKLKKISLTLGTFWMLGILSSWDQPFSAGINSDPQVLVSPAPASSKQNLDPTLVNIKAVDAPAFHMQDGKMGVGSEERFGQGIIIDPSGIIATNRHIVGHARHIYVMLSDGNIYEATVLHRAQADLCLIKINAPLPLETASLADPTEIQVGSNVFAMANASLNPQRVHMGQIIKIFKEIATNDLELLEMNIPLRPGDSGGAVFNEDGSLLGLIMGKQISDPSKSYAIPSSQILQEYFKYRNSILN